MVDFKDGRYEVSFPFKEFHQELGHNYLGHISKGRLKDLFKKFKENKELLFEYDKIISEQNNINIVKKVTDYEVGATHYVAHRPVIKEDKETTKTRIVFDASCKNRVKEPSLNDILESGPLLTPFLTDGLLRFRSFNSVLVANIKKAFHQISLNPDHRNLVRFLWFKDIENFDFERFENNPLTDHRFCRVLFGVTSSPFVLAATLINHISISMKM